MRRLISYFLFLSLAFSACKTKVSLSGATIPDEAKDRLLAIGKWLAINGEAIYGTRPWKIFGEGPTQVAGGAFTDDKDKPFTADDIRFTIKGDDLFAISLDIPKKDLLIKNLSLLPGNGKIKSVELLGSGDKVNWLQTKNGLVIKPSAKYPAENAVVYKIRVIK